MVDCFLWKFWIERVYLFSILKKIYLKKAYWIPALILLFFIGDRVGAYVLKKALEKSQFRYSRLYQKQAAADMLFLGNSRGLIFYQPYIEVLTGKSTFNLSYNGMDMFLGAALAKDYFERYPAPAKMIIDITMCDRVNEKLTASYDLYTPYSSNIAQLIKAQSPKVYYGAELTHLFRYNTELFQRSMRYLTKDDEDWIVDRVISQSMMDNIAKEKPYQIGCQTDRATKKYIGYIEELPALLEQLNQLVKLAQQKGTKVELVVNPYYIPFAQKMLNLNAFIKKVEQATGHKVHDYSKAIQGSAGFGDYQHLNKTGAKQYIDLLKRDGVLW